MESSLLGMETAPSIHFLSFQVLHTVRCIQRYLLAQGDRLFSFVVWCYGIFILAARKNIFIHHLKLFATEVANGFLQFVLPPLSSVSCTIFVLWIYILFSVLFSAFRTDPSNFSKAFINGSFELYQVTTGSSLIHLSFATRRFCLIAFNALDNLAYSW